MQDFKVAYSMLIICKHIKRPIIWLKYMGQKIAWIWVILGGGGGGA